MTIPSRPAPSPPRQSITGIARDSHSSTINFPSKLKKECSTSSTHQNINKAKVAPPRPPPPKFQKYNHVNVVLKKPSPPQSISVLSSIFGRKKDSKKFQSLSRTQTPSTVKHVKSSKTIFSSNSPQNTDVQLINFDSEPNSPTLTQKSNSDCVSVNSFGSDSNFSLLNTGSSSQAESGFEDDFSIVSDPWENNISNNSRKATTESKTYHSIRNIKAISQCPKEDPLNNGRSLLSPTPMLSVPTIIKPKKSLISNITKKEIKSLMMPLKSPEVSSSNSNEILDDSLCSLPMPSYPPPSPPSAELVNSLGDIKTGFEESSYGIALYNFEGVEDGDLSFKENEKIYLLRKLNEEWFVGRKKNGCEGIFPSNYIKVKIPLNDFVDKNELMKTPGESLSCSIMISKQARAIYKFNAELPEDLALEENDIINVIYQINEDWLYGEVGSKRGQFPATFIEYILHN